MDKIYLKGILRTLVILLIITIIMPTIAMANTTYFAQIPAGYEKSCNLCHTTAPNLNDFGISFKNTGYKFPTASTTPSSPSAYPASGTYGRYVWLYFQQPYAGAIIRYTLNGQDPRLEGNLYANTAIVLDPLNYPNGRVTVKAVTQLGEQFSTIATFNYTIQAIDLRNLETIPEGYPNGSKISFSAINLTPNQNVNVKIGKWIGDINTDPSGWNSINWYPTWSTSGVVSTDGKWVNVTLPTGIPAGNYFVEFSWVDPQGQTSKIVWSNLKVMNAIVTKIEITLPQGKTYASPGDIVGLKVIGENLSSAILTLESGTWPSQQRQLLYLSGGPNIVTGQYTIPEGTAVGTWKVVGMGLNDLYSRYRNIWDTTLIPNATFSIINTGNTDYTPVEISSIESYFSRWVGITIRAFVRSGDVESIRVGLISPLTKNVLATNLKPDWNGYYSGSISIPDNFKLEEGLWTTKILYSCDHTGNYVYPSLGWNSSYYNELLSRTIPLIVDYTPPVINDFNIALESDAATGNWLLKIRAWATDILSRVDYAFFNFRPVRDDIYYPISVYLKPVTETQSDGANLTGTVIIPKNAPLGSWTLTDASISDEHWNWADYTDNIIKEGRFSLAGDLDFTGDGWLDINDLQTQSLAYGQKAENQNSKLDVNTDGTIDLFDMVFLVRRTSR
ncbi:MAG: chitobiase/beta-hexosaminidase C-terminal domain-containing protein [Bacillota bacterium]